MKTQNLPHAAKLQQQLRQPQHEVFVNDLFYLILCLRVFFYFSRFCKFFGFCILWKNVFQIARGVFMTKKCLISTGKLLNFTKYFSKIKNILKICIPRLNSGLECNILYKNRKFSKKKKRRFCSRNRNF